MADPTADGWRSKLLEIALGVAAALCLLLVTGLNSRVSDLENRLRIVEIAAAETRSEIKAMNSKLDVLWNWAGIDKRVPPGNGR